MAGVVTLTLSTLPPSANGLWRIAGGGRGYAAPRYAAWKRLAMQEIQVQRPGKIAGAYVLDALFCRPDARRRDLDNLIKPLSDVLVAMGVVEDDSHAQRIEIAWVDDGPAVWCRVIRKSGGAA